MKVDKNIFYKLIRFISIFMFFYIIFLLLLIDTNVNYIHMNNSKFSNCIVVLFLIIAILILRKVSVKFRKCNMKAEYIDIIIKILFFGLLFFQFIVIESILFKTRWDVEQIMNAANDLSKTGVLSNNNYYSQYPYFDIYPNNVLLTFIFSLIIRLGNMFNFHNGYKMCVCVGTLLVDLSGIFLSKTVYNLTENNKLKLLSFILFVLLIGISPWFLIPYSDTYSIFLTTLVLYNYTKKEKKYLNYFAIGLISCFGYLIKPTCLIVLIAIFIVEFYLLLLRNNKFNSKSIMKILACLLGVTVIFFYNSIICKYIKYEQNYKYTFTPYHYLMMGTNCETLGTYSSEDVLNSINIMDYNKRIEYNKKVFMERFNSMTLVEKIKFYSKKILINYNDGTFAWGREGGFYGRRYKNCNR